MWSSEKSEHHKHNKSFSSSTSTTSSSTSPISSNPKPLRTMEEVWKDINVPSLPGEDPHHITNKNFHDVNLQDFLAQPFAKNPQKTSIFSSTISPPTHVLNLNSGTGFNFDEPSRLTIEDFASNSTSGFVCGSKKRFTNPDENTGDRRYKRMIKNRESAARSRARKQAYRYELEQEFESLKEENARLKKQQQLCLEEAPQLPTKNTLYRTSSSPF